ncbi:GTPase HflX [bacterium BMS3Bbin06]|nr:GTPase HflX [bacterium BMS3Abin08]GBE33498.1 GTPase HflX [bacterium BMS3Bbin06]HDO35647.1 GTPase HflX [Nitrospirota bacterium]HDY70438.1 GTPase HflX [Nitrospirota bacterium]
MEIASVFGNTAGLKKQDIKTLERLYRRRIPPEKVFTQEIVRFISDLSLHINRQVAILVNRAGVVTHVIIGDSRGIFIPDLSAFPLGKKALRGLRLIHTHLSNEPLNLDDMTDLALLRFDIIIAVGIKDSLPHTVYAAYLLPESSERPYEIMEPARVYSFHLDFQAFIRSVEEEMDRLRYISPDDKRERAILISVSNKPRHEQEESIAELNELAGSADVVVLGSVVQRIKVVNPRLLMGMGRLRELIIEALSKGATLLIFNQNLTPSQMKAIAELTELKVIDRTQLILDIFAKRAHTGDGKVQVELAQLKYRLPRLTGKGTAMSRLTGGIGGRGPGEMKLEIDRRRVRDRIHLLERELKKLSKARYQRKRRRVQRGIPIVSIVGYTNAGKSTLLNNLTESGTFTEKRMFATLDTASRRLRFPREREIIITDTVGFIRDLPKDLMSAFKSTLEELDDADLLIQLVDASNPGFELHIQSVERTLRELGLSDKERLLVFNKIDKLPPEEAGHIAVLYSAVSISALDRNTFPPLLSAIEERLWSEKPAGMVV